MWLTIIYKDYLHFDNEKDIHTSSKNYEDYEYGHDTNLLIIWH